MENGKFFKIGHNAQKLVEQEKAINKEFANHHWEEENLVMGKNFL